VTARRHRDSGPASAIRTANRDDIPEIASLIDAAFAPFRGHAPAAALDAYIDNSRSIGERWDEAEVLVAESGVRIAGTITFDADASREGLGLPQGWAGFRTLAVHPDMRGRGLGRLLVDQSLKKARRCGARTVGIHTASFMKAACDLYEKSGFLRCPEHDLLASDILTFDKASGDVLIIAYRLDLATCGLDMIRQGKAAEPSPGGGE
jgi:predicted N-acetyltransferase YhbS